MKSILMVCRGNICRSPMAEGFFSQQLANIQSSIKVTSAGIAALVDYPADPLAQTVMSHHDMDISNHRARQLNDHLIQTADLILVMTQSHINHITLQFSTAKDKIFLLGHYQQAEIQDPYKQSLNAFEQVYQQIEIAWQAWKTRI